MTEEKNCPEFWTEEKKDIYTRAIRILIGEIYDMDAKYYQEKGHHFIRFVEHRLKTTQSITAKIERKYKKEKGKPVEELLHDLAGVRVICFDTNQIYALADMIKSSDRFEVKKEKNYIENPKDNGYQSYHIIMTVDDIKVELQIRTILMDAWSSLESILIYKKNTPVPKKLKDDIIRFSKWSKKMDKMLKRILEY